MTFCHEVKNDSNHVSKDLFCMMVSLLHVLPLANDWWTNCNATTRNATTQDLWVIHVLVLSSDEKFRNDICQNIFLVMSERLYLSLQYPATGNCGCKVIHFSILSNFCITNQVPLNLPMTVVDHDEIYLWYQNGEHIPTNFEAAPKSVVKQCLKHKTNHGIALLIQKI